MVRLSPVERALIEERHRAGVPSRQIARELGRAYRTVHDQVDRLRRRPPRSRVLRARTPAESLAATAWASVAASGSVMRRSVPPGPSCG